MVVGTTRLECTHAWRGHVTAGGFCAGRIEGEGRELGWAGKKREGREVKRLVGILVFLIKPKNEMKVNTIDIQIGKKPSYVDVGLTSGPRDHMLVTHR